MYISHFHPPKIITVHLLSEVYGHPCFAAQSAWVLVSQNLSLWATVFGMHSWYLRKQESVLTCKFLLFCVLTKHQDDKSEGAWFGFSRSALFVGNPQFQGAELRAFALDLNSCSSSNSVRCWVSEQSLGKECSGCPVKWGDRHYDFTECVLRVLRNCE